MADIADCQNIADDAVAVAVDGLDIGFDVFLNHGSLKLGTLVRIESYIVRIVIEAQSGHIQLAGGAVGRLTVVPYKGLVLVGNFACRLSRFLSSLSLSRLGRFCLCPCSFRRSGRLRGTG